MDDFDISDIPLSKDVGKPDTPDSKGNAGVSHSPLNLGGGSNDPAPAAKPKPQIKMPAPSKIGASAKHQEQDIVSTERITGVKTFFTKLHAGAILFLEEIIGKWLKENPGVVIKQTNVITGEIQGKKTEPNLIITVWY